MGFYLSPKVDFNEIDLSTSVAASATSIAAIVLRNTYKGIENEKMFASTVDGLIQAVGEPTDKSYIDLLSATGYLKYGSNLYYSVVKPADATFAGGNLGETYGIIADPAAVNGTDWTDFGSGTPKNYSFETLGISSINDVADIDPATLFTATDTMSFFAVSRGLFGNKIRVIVFDAKIYNAVKYVNLSTGLYKTPTGVTLDTDAKLVVDKLYTDYNAGTNMTLATIKDLDLSLVNNKQFCVLVQIQEQTATVWKTAELFLVSSDENAIDDEGNSIFAETSINEQSLYIRVVLNEEAKNADLNVCTLTPKQFGGGANGTWESDEETSACIMGYEEFADAEEIDVNLFIDADKPTGVKDYLISLSQDTRRDSFAILDVPKTLVYNKKGTETMNVVNWRMGLDTENFNPNTSYAAVYANWLEVYDKWSKKYRWVPASGFVAGLYANNDDVADAWWAPAGLNRGILTNIRRLAWNPKEGDRDILYKNGVNPICSFAGQGKVIWGQKTLLDKSSAFNRVNVRRLFLVLEKAIASVSKYFLFEQNDEITRMLFVNMIEPYLRDIKGRRGIYDFKVQCDEIINTPEVIDRNEFRANIFIKATRSAEFIVLNFINTKTGANFEELVVA